MGKRTLKVEQLALWILGLQDKDNRVIVTSKARKQRSTLVLIKLRMLGYALFQIASTKANAIFRSSC